MRSAAADAAAGWVVGGIAVISAFCRRSPRRAYERPEFGVPRQCCSQPDSIYDSGNAATGHPALSKAGPDIRYQMVACCLACLECWRSLAAVERVLPQQ